jgi:Skp family chaperone for outer membrane proteins
LGAEFNQRVQYFANLEAKYSDAQQLIAKLQEECETLKNKLEGTNIAISGS